MIHEAVKELSSASLPIRFRQHISAKKLSTLSIGGECELLVEPNSQQELARVLQIIHALDMPWRVIGFGSNSLFPDEGLQGITIKLGAQFRYVRPSTRTGSFVVGASMPLMGLSRLMCSQGLSGLEFAGGIPASIGGAVRMNAGAHGSEMASIIDTIRGFSSQGEEFALTRSEAVFGYRHCNLESDAVVFEVELSLAASDRDACSALMKEFLRSRKQHQPLTVPSAGSIFRNPIAGGRTAGQLLEDLDLKGTKVGGAEVSLMHANWIVNPTRTATARDVIALVELCQSRAMESYGVALTPELVRWSPGREEPVSIPFVQL